MFILLIGTFYLTSALRAKPQLSSCRAEMDDARLRQNLGDRTENPLFEYVHGYYCAQAVSKSINPAVWKTVDFPEGTLVVHQDFIATEMNRAKKANVSLTESQMVRYLREFLRQAARSKKRYQDIVALIKKPKDRFPSLRSAGPARLTLIALPSYEDDPSLWDIASPMGDINQLAPPWTSMHEAGIIMSSNKKITEFESHDFFTQIMQQSKGMHIPIDEVVRTSARHEGSHGDIESALIRLLGLKTDTPIYEGIPSALSSDNAVRIRTDITASELLSNPYPESSRRGESSYYAGSKYWTALYEIKKGSSSDIAAWADIFTEALLAADEMSHKPHIQNENARIAAFMQLLLSRLHIDRNQFEKMYMQLNQ